MTDGWIERRSPGFWIGAILGLMGLIAGLSVIDAIGKTTSILLMASTGVLLYPLMKAGERCEDRSGTSSPAVRRYNRGMLAASLAYIAGLGIAVWLTRAAGLEGPILWAIAALPILPIFAMIWVMARYIMDEQDEYLRHLAIMSNMGGLALLMGLASLWGFFEEFELVPHAPGWLSVPVWALGMGLTRWWIARSNRAEQAGGA
ncbi:hypothetical protein [Aurantiacibacter rhizosphaerae]|uniref:Uncharacterized protein n=1 Tax=Aurantiacibacter rhizosphaerae TaxID=2691582 RepID=A0A844XAU3_9SPHN|nr:hypothetical protein [Aurantiacibacter rhizosphaerae]MWV26899.1 hypothetical protein [Aurantiacibacter rhizosphaerae]